MAAIALGRDDLGSGFAGRVVLPDDDEYEETRRIWNGAIDRRPAAVVRCTCAADVAAAIRLARERELPLAVRGGGHGVGGHAVCDDGVVVDLSPLKAVDVDPAAKSVKAQAGVLWGELDAATQAFGLATTGGIVTHTGIAGLTLGGGIGWLMRKHGATVDNLLSAEVVTADGDVVVARDDENADLFWGLRGGGGNFGVVTTFEYRLHDLGPTVLAGPIYHALDDAPRVLRFYRDFVAECPDELTTILNLRLAPPLPFLPEDVHGRPVIALAVCYAGPVEEGEKVLRPLREFGSPLVDVVGPRPYTTLQGMFDPTVPHGWHYYWKSLELPPFTDHAIDTLVEYAGRLTSPRSYCIVFQLGGAVARVDEDATAYPQRDAAHNVNINAVWTEDDGEPERHVRWARDYFAAMQPHGRGRVYLNFLGDEGQDRVRAAYGDSKYERLAALKARYDPDNVFRLNQNIRPAA
jgi:FAD/FMN-containing dehydrogenase